MELKFKSHYTLKRITQLLCADLFGDGVVLTHRPLGNFTLIK